MTTGGNGRGAMRPHTGGRSPPFIVIGLLVVIAILGFNYWNVSSKNSVLARDIADLSERYRLASVKKLAVEKRNDVLMAKVQETENEVKKNQVIMTKKQEELNNVNAQHSAVNEEAQSCKSELDKCSSEQYQSRQTIKDLEHAVEEAQSERDARVKESEDCKVALEAAHSSVPNCSTDLETQRSKLLETVKTLWGSAAVSLLGKSGIDITGVSLDAAQNAPQIGQQNWAQQQPGMKLANLPNGGGQIQGQDQIQGQSGQTQGQGQGGLNNMVNGAGEGQGQYQNPVAPQGAKGELNAQLDLSPGAKSQKDLYAPGRLPAVSQGEAGVNAAQGIQSNAGADLGQPSVNVQPGLQGKTGLQAPDPDHMSVGDLNPSDEHKPALQVPPEMNERVGPPPPLGPQGEPGLNGPSHGENSQGQAEGHGQNVGILGQLAPVAEFPTETLEGEDEDYEEGGNRGGERHWVIANRDTGNSVETQQAATYGAQQPPVPSINRNKEGERLLNDFRQSHNVGHATTGDADAPHEDEIVLHKVLDPAIQPRYTAEYENKMREAFHALKKGEHQPKDGEEYLQYFQEKLRKEAGLPSGTDRNTEDTYGHTAGHQENPGESRYTAEYEEKMKRASRALRDVEDRPKDGEEYLRYFQEKLDKASPGVHTADYQEKVRSASLGNTNTAERTQGSDTYTINKPSGYQVDDEDTRGTAIKPVLQQPQAHPVDLDKEGSPTYEDQRPRSQSWFTHMDDPLKASPLNPDRVYQDLTYRRPVEWDELEEEDDDEDEDDDEEDDDYNEDREFQEDDEDTYNEAGVGTEDYPKEGQFPFNTFANQEETDIFGNPLNQQNDWIQTAAGVMGDMKLDGGRSKRATKSPAVAGTGAQTDTVPQYSPQTGDRLANQVDTYGVDSAKPLAQDNRYYQHQDTAIGQDTADLRDGSLGNRAQIHAPDGVGQANDETLDAPLRGDVQDVRDPGMYRQQNGPGIEDDTDYKNRAGDDDEDEENVRPLGQDLQYKKDQYDAVNRLDNVQDVGGNDDGIDQMHQNMADRLGDDEAQPDPDDADGDDNDDY